MAVSNPRIAAIIVAAGSGERLQSAVPKAYVPLGGVPMVSYSVQSLNSHPQVARTLIAIHPDHAGHCEAAISGLTPVSWVAGGATRSDSVRNALKALASDAPDMVLIHDAARPFLSHAVIDRLIAACTPTHAVMPVLASVDTLREQAGGAWRDVPRESIMRVQTPQAAYYAPLVAAYDACGESATDDISIWQANGGSITTVEGDEMLRKITYPHDVAWATREVAHARTARVASGYDVHRFVAGGSNIRIGGIDIAHDASLDGHSDADVALHALTDALLGTLADGDIGSHFPPSDTVNKNRDSAAFIIHARDKIRAAGGSITHVDVTIICEAPKIGPHRDAMRARIAELLGVDARSVSVKATTTEGLGFTGRREGIAAQALATVSYTEFAA